jgi:hypothetical protein
MHNYLASTYTNKAYTHNYIFTFTYCHVVYATVINDMDANALMTITKVDKASRGAGMALRFRPTNDIKRYLIAMGAQVLCSDKYFNEVFHSDKYNKGETAEKLVTEQMFGQEWVKDSVPFTAAGDIEVNGIAYQHKHEGATFCNEKTLRNLC